MTGIAGSALTRTGSEPLDEPQELVRVTVMFPEEADADHEVIMEPVPCPEVMITPEGTTQL